MKAPSNNKIEICTLARLAGPGRTPPQAARRERRAGPRPRKFARGKFLLGRRPIWVRDGKVKYGLKVLLFKMGYRKKKGGGGAKKEIIKIIVPRGLSRGGKIK